MIGPGRISADWMINCPATSPAAALASGKRPPCSETENWPLVRVTAAKNGFTNLSAWSQICSLSCTLLKSRPAGSSIVVGVAAKCTSGASNNCPPATLTFTG